MKTAERFIRGAAALVVVGMNVFLAGCATQAMKGTPFYTGEYAERRGPAEDRVNLWPLLYYRDPALSVLWPLMELSDDHFALRPLMSVYGLEDEDRVYNVLWPLARFDYKSDYYRIFPVFWGDDYRAVFPLYWHHGEPLGAKGGFDCLIPLWSYTSDSRGYSANVLWPFFHLKDRGASHGGRVWPLFGCYTDGDDQYRFWCWPLGHQWSEESGSAGHTFLPLYFAHHDRVSRRFFSLPYSHGTNGDGTRWTCIPPVFSSARDDNRSLLLSPLFSRGFDRAEDTSWQLLFPLYYTKQEGRDRIVATLLGGYKRGGDAAAWFAAPLLSGGRRSGEESDTWLLGPLAHVGHDASGSSSHVFPLYYRSQHDNRSLFLSLPWSSSRDADGDGWQLVPPLAYRAVSKDGSMLVTPLYARGSSESKHRTWDAAFPLYYRSDTDGSRLFATLLGGWRANETGKRWLIYPLLSGGGWGEDKVDLWLAAPLFHYRGGDGKSSHHLLPLYYWDGEDDTFLSPFASRWTRGSDGAATTLVPPLLSWYTQGDSRSDLWGLGGLAHYSWGEKAGSRHLFPLFYSDPAKSCFLSPVLARWRGGDERTTTLVPPTLSWMTSGRRRSDLWVAGPLAHFSWGEDAGTQHVFPLYYRNAVTRSFMSPLIASWAAGRDRWTVIPPLLSGYIKGNDEQSVFALLGLFYHRWCDNPDDDAGHLAPVYLFEGKELLLTPIFGWNRNAERGFVYPLTPLFGLRTGTARSGSWLFPFYGHTRETGSGRIHGHVLWGPYSFESDSGRSSLFPFYNYKNYGPLDDVPKTTDRITRRGTSLRYLLVGQRRDELIYTRAYGGSDVTRTHEKKSGFFPLWGYRSHRVLDRDEEEVDGSLLLALYDYHREVTPRDGQEANRYTRSRVLWRLWHYERLNGDVSVDVFPAITYDRRKDGFRMVSFLWRVFRYERGPEGTKLDIIVPLIRQGPDGQ